MGRSQRAYMFLALLALGLTSASSGAATTTPAASRDDPHQALRSVADDYWEFYLRQNPEIATEVGDNRYNDRLTDYSLARVDTTRNDATALLARARSLDGTRLSAGDRLDQQLLVRVLSDTLEWIRLKGYEMPIDQMSGVHLLLPRIASVAPFDTVQDFRDYIARLKAVPAALDQVIELSRGGIRDGLVPPRFVLEKAAEQCAGLADAAGASSPFAEPAKRIPDTIPTAQREQLRQAIISTVDGQVRPAYARLKTFITEEYVPKGRADPGIWSLPDGDARYRFFIELATSTKLTADEIHAIGLTQVADLERQIEALARRAGYSDRASFEKAVYADPKNRGASRQQILDRFTRFIGQMEPKLPQLFGILPKSKLIVTSVPAYMENESSTQYVPGTPDGSRPGQVWVLTSDYATHDLLDDEATAYHEGVPGHHMQTSIAQELPDIHPFHRSYDLPVAAYVEGWALYAEQLGKEVGFYQDPVSDLGRLRSELYRALRLVVDTGVHAKRWSRQQMVDYWNLHLPPASDAEMDRYITWPGQALAYKIGQLKILELRQRAKDALGPKFDLKAFHDQVLSAGPLPLDMLDSRIAEWIETVKGR